MAEFIRGGNALLNADHVSAAQWLDDVAGGRTLKVWLDDGTDLTFDGEDAVALWSALGEAASREPWES